MYFSSTMICTYICLGLVVGVLAIAGGIIIAIGYTTQSENKVDGFGFGYALAGLILFIALAAASLFPIFGKTHQTITYNQYQQMTSAPDEVFVDTAKDTIWLKDGDKLMTLRYPASVEKTASLLTEYDGRYHRVMNQTHLGVLLLLALFLLCTIPMMLTHMIIRNINKKAWTSVPGAGVHAQDDEQSGPRFRILD